MIVYTGDASNITNRVRKNHCGGNVEGSALRQHVANAIGYQLSREKRLTSKSVRIRVDLPDPKVGEKAISQYIKSGYWRFVICDSEIEAQDFQWYVIETIKPIFNINQGTWKRQNIVRYEALFQQLIKSEEILFNQINNRPTGPGVYIFYHINLPIPQKRLLPG